MIGKITKNSNENKYLPNHSTLLYLLRVYYSVLLYNWRILKTKEYLKKNISKQWNKFNIDTFPLLWMCIIQVIHMIGILFNCVHRCSTAKALPSCIHISISVDTNWIQMSINYSLMRYATVLRYINLRSDESWKEKTTAEIFLYKKPLQTELKHRNKSLVFTFGTIIEHQTYNQFCNETHDFCYFAYWRCSIGSRQCFHWCVQSRNVVARLV